MRLPDFILAFLIGSLVSIVVIFMSVSNRGLSHSLLYTEDSFYIDET